MLSDIFSFNKLLKIIVKTPMDIPFASDPLIKSLGDNFNPFCHLVKALSPG